MREWVFLVVQHEVIFPRSGAGSIGRTILVRNIWSDITADSCRFEQSFSDDGGKTWEVNWIAVDTRVKD